MVFLLQGCYHVFQWWQSLVVQQSMLASYCLLMACVFLSGPFDLHPWAFKGLMGSLLTVNGSSVVDKALFLLSSFSEVPQRFLSLVGPVGGANKDPLTAVKLCLYHQCQLLGLGGFFTGRPWWFFLWGWASLLATDFCLPKGLTWTLLLPLFS